MKTYWQFFSYIFLIGIAIQFSKADEIYLKSGVVLRNVKFVKNILNFDGDVFVVFIFNGKNEELLHSSIIKIELSTYNETQPSLRDNMSDSLFQSIQPIQKPLEQRDTIKYLEQRLKELEYKQSLVPKRYSYPNIQFLTVTALGLVVGWDGFARSGNIQDAIDANNKLSGLLKIEIDNSSLESEKTRAMVIGIVGFGVALTATIFSMEKVEIKTDGKSLSLAYSF